VPTITSHKELRVYKLAFKAAMDIFEVSRGFPKEEQYALTDQMRRSSRSVCANIAEAWRKRRYRGAFIQRLSDSDTEAAETQTWLDFSLACEYLDKNQVDNLSERYDHILSMLVKMMTNPEPWLLIPRK
jgi:four helix bundle protein